MTRVLCLSGCGVQDGSGIHGSVLTLPVQGIGQAAAGIDELVKRVVASCRGGS